MNTARSTHTSTVGREPNARRRTVLTLGGSLAIVAALAAGQAQAAPAATATAPATASVTSVTDPTLAALTVNREEERMARDLYAALAEHYDGALPFSRITRSEQAHWNAVGTLLARYGVTDPSANRAAGSYADATIQALYDDWLARGRTSLDAAYQVGVELEQRDIADLTVATGMATRADVNRVLTNLLVASTHHLAAYRAASSGALTPGTGNGMGTGNRMGNGMGTGNRMGNGMGPGTHGRADVGGGMDDCPNR